MKSTSALQYKKAKLILSIISIFFIAAIVLAARWQIFDSEEFIAIANERYRTETIPSVRGSILASDDSPLAFSEPRFDLYVWLPDIEQAEKKKLQTREEFITKVAPLIGVSSKQLKLILNNGQLWIKIGDKITVNQKDAILELRQDQNPGRYLQGLQFEYVNQRLYPEKKLASHVVGFVGLDANSNPKGVGGLEQYWEGSLKPIDGFEIGEYDSFGNPITLGDQSILEPKPGVTIHTTIDKYLQKKLEEQLKIGMQQFQAKNITGIIVDPKTGAILAMANFPDYNPNKYFLEKDGSVFGNMAITVPYEIGSVAKVFTVSAAVDSKNVKINDVVLPNGHDGCEIISPNPKPGASCFDKDQTDAECICTFDRKIYHQTLSVSQGLINSDNIALRHIAMTMSYKTYREYLAKFGVGSLSGVDLAGESTGVLKDYDDWNYADQAVYSYGHGYQITPLQAIMGVAAVANHGNRMQPYLVKKLEEADGAVTQINPKVVQRVISAKTANLVIKPMQQVYQNALSGNEYKDLAVYNIAMKSGTALIPYRDRPGYSSEINATYVGFDASPDRKFIMLIKLESPQVGDLSFYNARNVWLNTFRSVKDYLGFR